MSAALNPPNVPDHFDLPRLKQEVTRLRLEVELVRHSDRITALPDDVERRMARFLEQFPFARLIRDGVRDSKFAVCEVGGSRHFGSGSTALGAWLAALNH